MKKEAENLSPEQSLQLIADMIHQAKGNVSSNSKYFLLWGWCIALANFGMYALMKFTDYPRPYIVWLLTVPALIITIIYSVKEKKQTATTFTHVDRIAMWQWIGFFAILLPVIAFGGKINYQINTIIILFTALPTFLSGIILRFRPLVWGGVSFWIFGTISFMADAQTQPLIGALAIIMGYLIPGYLLKNRKN